MIRRSVLCNDINESPTRMTHSAQVQRDHMYLCPLFQNDTLFCELQILIVGVLWILIITHPNSDRMAEGHEIWIMTEQDVHHCDNERKTKTEPNLLNEIGKTEKLYTITIKETS